MKTLRDLVVGDPVLVSFFGKSYVRAEVTKVGRKYLTTAREQFDRETGRWHNDYSGHARTLDEHANDALHTNLRGALDQLVSALPWRQSKIPDAELIAMTEQIQAMTARVKR